MAEVNFEIDEEEYNEFLAVCAAEGYDPEWVLVRFFEEFVKAHGFPFEV